MSTPKFAETHNLVTFLEKPTESEGFEQINDFLNANPIKYALMINPTIYTSCIKQFWATTKVKTVNEKEHIQDLVDKKKVIITETSVRSDLHLEDVEGTECLPTTTIFEQLTLMGTKTTAWNEFSSTMASWACPHHGFFELHQLDTLYNALNVNDQDSLNSAAGGNFLDKMPSDCLKIIESKSKVSQSRAKAVVAKVNSSSSTPAISSDVAKLKDMVRELLLEKKNQSSAPAPAPAPSPTPAPVKAVEPNCVTCGGTHSYQNCPATNGNVYQDNIQEYVSQAAAANTAKETPVFDLRWLQIKFNLPDFLPFKIIKTISIGGILLIKTETQSVSQTDFERYVKANDAVLRNIQSQSQRSGTLFGNTITNPKEYLKGITTRSGVAYQGPTIPTSSKVVKQETKVTKDQVQTPSSQSTAPVQPPVAQSETPVSDPVVAPVSALMPNLKLSIPYPSRRDNERRRGQVNEQIEKFYEIFKDMSFEISFTDALILDIC
nr:reverse transcriptase domain-containing protein [Tanacetum cinerariifolium]